MSWPEVFDLIAQMIEPPKQHVCRQFAGILCEESCGELAFEFEPFTAASL